MRLIAMIIAPVTLCTEIATSWRGRISEPPAYLSRDPYRPLWPSVPSPPAVLRDEHLSTECLKRSQLVGREQLFDAVQRGKRLGRGGVLSLSSPP